MRCHTPTALGHARPAVHRTLGLGLLVLLGLGGCATKDAVFVTKTSFSILDVDSTPAGISVAHDRVEPVASRPERAALVRGGWERRRGRLQGSHRVDGEVNVTFS